MSSSSWRSFRSHRFHFIFYDPLYVYVSKVFFFLISFFCFSRRLLSFLVLNPRGVYFFCLRYFLVTFSPPSLSKTSVPSKNCFTCLPNEVPYQKKVNQIIVYHWQYIKNKFLSHCHSFAVVLMYSLSQKKIKGFWASLSPLYESYKTIGITNSCQIGNHFSCFLFFGTSIW